MGVVWKAVDTTLDRDVAIKVLPDAFAAHSERLTRFEREAKVLASLSHPNVAGIYGLHEAGGTRFLAMELVLGEELLQRIARGPLGIEQALPIALGIAEALEYAHERGIVHRDLKPANVKLTTAGAVKVLDFGLAKALDPVGADSSPASLLSSPTITLAATQAGVILGTAAYMSPEQAAGQVADRRADIWAFGVVLYEMLAGRPLFAGETVSHVLAAVLKDEPAWSALPADVPPRLLELLQRCLCKKTRGRLQSIGDARVYLEEWVADPRTLAPPAQPVAGRSRTWIAAAFGAVGLLLAALAWRSAWDRAPGAAAVLRFPLTLEQGQKLALDDYPAVAISPDGRRQVIVVRGEDGTERLVLREVDRLDTRVLEGTEGGCAPFFSPDGEWVAFFANSSLEKIAVAGGTPVSLAAVSPNVRGATWGPDGTIYLADNVEGGLKRIPEGGGELTPLTELNLDRAERTHRWPTVLPGGRAVLFTSDTQESTEFYDDARIEAVSVADGARRVVVEQSSQAQYLASGPLVFARGGSLYAVPFDPVSLETAGAPTLVLQGVATDLATGAVHFAVSGNGSILYASGEPSAGARSDPVWVGRDGNRVRTGIEPGRHGQVSLSPDDRRLALLSRVGQSAEMWVTVADLERGTLSRLTFEGSATEPVWAPDGRRIAYSSNPGQSHGADILWKSADGSGEAEVLWSDDASKFPMAFSPDGSLLAVDRATGGASDIWILPLARDRQPWPFIESRFNEYMAEFSPDGRFVAYVSDENGTDEVYVRSFPVPAGRWQISAEGGREPRWSADGRELFYRNRGDLLRVAIDTANGFRAGRPERLFDGLETGGNPHTYDVSRDGRFVHLRPVDRQVEPTQVNLVLNWDAEVRRASRRPE